MRGVNRVTILGTLGKDPEVKYAANGNAIANLSVATSEQWTDKATGQKQEKTEWHRVVIFGKLAEIAGQYLTKGSQVYFEGKLQTRKWQDQTSGQDRYTTEIVVDGFGGVMQMLGGRQNNAQSAQQGGYQHPPQQQANNFQQPQQQNPNMNPNGTPKTPQQMQSQSPQYTPNDFDSDDVPF